VGYPLGNHGRTRDLSSAFRRVAIPQNLYYNLSSTWTQDALTQVSADNKMAHTLTETGRIAGPDSSKIELSNPENHSATLSSQKENSVWNPSTDDDFAVLAIRNLAIDMCMQNGGGHAGSALGMAAIGVALWKYVMRYNPGDPEWFDRDRFVLSNG
jgi:hypothetical protein